MSQIRRAIVVLGAALLIPIFACTPTLSKPKKTMATDETKTPDPDRETAPDFQQWLEELGREALARGIRPEVVREALNGLQPAPVVVTPRHKQAEFSLSKSEYVRRLASEHRFQEGLKKLAQYRTLLQKVSTAYGVAPPYLVALWAIESDFGQGGKRFPVIRALATQAYQGSRQAFFRRQLLAALTILDREGMNSEQLRGSWAGAMGHFQFIPTTYLDYAVDFNRDGHRNIWSDVEDALASAASYLDRAGWKKDREWGRRVEIPPGFDLSLAGLESGKSTDEWRKAGLPVDGETGDGPTSLILPDGPDGEAFLVTGNFRALMRWNRSVAFALAVGHLADRLAEGQPEATGERQP